MFRLQPCIVRQGYELFKKAQLTSFTRWYQTCSEPQNAKKSYQNQYLNELEYSIEHCKDGSTLLKLTRKALRFQIHDLSIWRSLETKFYELKKDLAPKELSLIVNYFKQIKISNSKIYENSIDTIVSSIQKYSIRDLSLLCISYSYYNKINIDFMNIIVDAILKVHEKEQDKILQWTKKEIYENFISYVHICNAFSKIKNPNCQLFKIASVYFERALTMDLTIPPKILMKLVDSYANAKIIHRKIMDLIVKLIPCMKFTDDDLKIIRNNLKVLKYSEETFDKYLEYRLS